MSAGWTDEIMQELHQWFTKDGLSSSQIAERLNRKYGTYFTRNAIMGKIHRSKMAYAGKKSRVRRKDAIHPPVPAPVKPRGPNKLKMAGLVPYAGSSVKKTYSVTRDRPASEIEDRKKASLAASSKMLDEWGADQQGMPWMEVDRGQCYWPLRDGFLCGIKTNGLRVSYCKDHQATSSKT